MNNTFKETWELYAQSWKAKTALEKQKLFEKCLDVQCQYNSPVNKTKGWQELVDNMLEFHQNIPGGYFKTSYFLAYDNKSIARWDMLNGEDVVLGDGISYCEYNESGKLSVMTGFLKPVNNHKI